MSHARRVERWASHSVTTTPVNRAAAKAVWPLGKLVAPDA